MKLKRSLSNIKLCLITAALTISLLVSSQNVYDTYNPLGSTWPSSTFTVGNTHQGYTGEYQLFTCGLNWNQFASSPGWYISYKIEPVSFPFVADCGNGDCGNANSTTRNFKIANPYVPTNWGSNNLFTYFGGHMSNWAQLASHEFTNVTPPSGQRDFLPHTALKHTYYLHCGSLLTDPVIDSFSFVIDHTRGMTSRYPFRADNGQSVESEHDIAIHAWVIYPDQAFLNSPVQTTNGMGTIDYFLYPDAHYFPGICAPSGYVIPDPTDGSAQAADADLFARPSPFSLRGFMLGEYSEMPFAGYDPSSFDPLPGISHTYYINYNVDLTTINPAERIIYNPSGAFITTPTTAPLIFPSGYTFETVGAIYPTAAEIATWNPNTMVDPRKVHVHGAALHLTDNPDTEIDDAHSFYTITASSKLVIEKCVTIWDAQIIVESGATLEYWPDELYGNVVITPLSGSTVIPHYGNSTVACPYLCTEADLYNDDQYHVYANTSFTTSNIATYFPGSAPWSAVTGNTVRFSQKLVVHSGYTLTVGAGVNLEFGPNAGIIVEEGARLIVNGTSTSGCKLGPACQMEWQGVQVLGDRTLGQGSASTTPQGYLELNYCTLEHALDGITVGDYYTYGTEGGVIRAYNSQFLNNVRDVQFLSYRNFGSTNYTLNNISIFSNCEFKTTEYFYDPSLYLDNGVTPTAGIAHVTMYDVRNVQFKDCDFANDNPDNYTPHLRGVGIFGIEAGFQLKQTNPCTFEGLSDAIWMQSSGLSTAGNIYIRGQSFTNNIHSIVMEGTFFTNILENEIDAPESPEVAYPTDALERGYNKPVGVYMIGSTDFRIEENEFNVGDNSTLLTTLGDCSDCSYDIVIHESAVSNPLTSLSFGSGTIYKNEINHSSMGVQVQGYNGSGASPWGLQVMCNSFDELRNFDVILIGRSSTLSQSSVYSEVRDQGDCDVTYPELQSQNDYLRSCTAGIDETNLAVGNTNFASGYIYYDRTFTFPQCTSAVITSHQCNNFNIPNPCDSRLSTRTYLSQSVMFYGIATENHEAAKDDLDSQVDGWKELGPEVWTDPPAFYSILSAYSPWLSDSTMLSLIQGSDRQFITDEDLIALLIANSGLSSEVYNAAINADPAFDSRLLQDLEDAQESGGLSARILKEQEWAAWVHQADLAANEITEYALRTDSLAQGISALLGAKPISEMQNLFVLQLAAREFEDAESTLGNILIEQEEEENAWTILAAISLEQQSDDRSWVRATTEEINAARDIYDLAPDAAIGARVVVGYYDKKNYSRDPFPLEENSSRMGQEPTFQSMAAGTKMTVFPNPSSGMTQVSVSPELIQVGTVLEITNTLGQVVNRIEVNSNDPVLLDLRGYADGMLYLRLVTNGIVVSTEKLLIVK